MNLKNIILSLFLSVFAFTTNAQSISGYSIGSAAGFFNENVSLNYNLGQINIVDNPYFKSVLTDFITEGDTISSSQNNNILLKCFPNPTTDYLNISITSKYDVDDIKISVFDNRGIVQNVNFTQNNSDNYSILKLNVKNFKTGVYFGLIKINNSYMKNFTFIIE